MNRTIFYFEVLECITTVNTSYNNRIYITKSEKKAIKLINWLCNHTKNDQTTSYALVKIKINEVETKNEIGVALKELSRQFYRHYGK